MTIDNWQQFHADRAFDEFIGRFVLQQKSYITKHDNKLGLQAGIADIKKRISARAGQYHKSSCWELLRASII